MIVLSVRCAISLLTLFGLSS